MYYFINSLTKTELDIFHILPNLIVNSNFSIYCQNKVLKIIFKNKLITNKRAYIYLCHTRVWCIC